IVFLACCALVAAGRNVGRRLAGGRAKGKNARSRAPRPAPDRAPVTLARRRPAPAATLARRRPTPPATLARRRPAPAATLTRRPQPGANRDDPRTHRDA